MKSKKVQKEIKVLLGGIQKFGSYNYNVAECIVDDLNGKIIETENGTRLKIIGLKLPINFSTFREVLTEGIKSIEPRIAIGLGMDFKDLEHLSFELSANVMPQYGENIKDTKENLGLNIPLDELVETIRIPNEKHMKNAIAQINGIKTSENAGSHMCETIFRDLIRLSNRGKKFQPSFIHVPHTPDLLTTSAQLDEHKKSISLEEQKAIIEAVIKRIGNFYL